MVETVTTVVVAGIAATIAVQRVDTTKMASDATLRQVQNVYVSAQQTALSKQYNVIVAVKYGSGQLVIVEDKNNSGLLDLGDRLTVSALDKETKVEDAPKPLAGFSGKGGIVKVSTGGNTTTGIGLPVTGDLVVTFRRNGAADGTAALFFKNKDSKSDGMRAILVTQSTGRTDGYRYDGSKWVRADS